MGCYRQLSFFGGLLNRWAGRFPVTFIDQRHGLLEPRDPGAVPSPVADWKHGTDGATDGTQRVRSCRDDGKVRRLGRELVELRGWHRV